MLLGIYSAREPAFHLVCVVDPGQLQSHTSAFELPYEWIYSESANAAQPHSSLPERQSLNWTYCLIRTSCRRTIQIRTQVNPQALVLAHIPRCHILPLNTGSAPCESVALICERAERVLATGEGHWQVSCRSARRLTDVGVELGAFGIDQLYQLPVHNLVLAG